MFLVYAFGGPEWNGKNMRTAHKHIKINENHFNLVIEHLVSTLKELGVN